jgi:alpha-L-rhamnosidase
VPTTAKKVRLAVIAAIAVIAGVGTTAEIAATGASAATGLEAPTQLRVNQITSPMAVPGSSAWLSWVTQDTRQNESQSAYEVRVAATSGAATSGTAVWDSGKVSGAAPWTTYTGPALARTTRYWWTVRTWDAEGNAGPWAAPAQFGTSVGSSWTVKPIWSPPAGGKTSGWAFLRGTITVANKPVVAATAYATGLSTAPTHQYVFRLSVNGKILGDGPALPTPNAVEYQAWDVTGNLAAGSKDTFGALAYTTTDQRFQLQVVVQYADGTRQVWGTGSSWQALDGGAVYPAAGSVGTAYYTLPVENLNAEKYPFGFDTPSFSAKGWSAPVVKSAISGLTPLPTANMVLVQHHPASVTQLGTGHYLIDFGTTQLGGLHLNLTGTAGRKVTIRYGEVLASPTSVLYHLTTGNVYQDTYTLKAGTQGLDVWGYRVFRYAEVINTPQAMTVSSTTDNDLVYPDQPSLSSMTTSNASLNEVWQFTKNSIDALNLDPYVDPARERGVYEGDNYIHQLSQAAVSGDTAEGLYSLQDGLADMALSPPQDSLTEYEMLAPVAALDSWYQSGDYQALSGMYSYLKAMLQPVGSDGLVTLPVSWLTHNNAQFSGPSAGVGQPSLDIPESTATVASPALRPAGVPTTLIDWPPSERNGFVFTGNVKDTVVNAFAYAAYSAMAQIAAKLGHTSDAGTYSGYAARLRSAISSDMFDSSTGAFYDGLSGTSPVVHIQHESMDTTVYVLAMGAATPSEAQKGAAFLASHGITAPGSSAGGACSVYCAAYYLQALYDGGQAQAAISQLTSGSKTSWLNMISLGAGSTMEAWDPSVKGNLSYSHAWATGPDFVVPQDLFGISPLTPGWGTVLIAPQPGNLASGTFTAPTARGPVTESFTQQGGGITVTVTIPTTATAQVALPGVQPGQTVNVDGQQVTATALTPSSSPLSIQDGVTVAAVQVQSGTHTITTG